ncbi:hypothetical protein [Candidatus Entotheonella palauensis]|uniref:hypothetical protein n=1 Tax=Candidatus Entotheonella palauensis TaxID=93172 RepID=UPI0004AE343D|nr:hypothetical protein [Candidatus Entotheonella palauensis]
MARSPAPKGWRHPAIIAGIIGAVAILIAALIGLIPKSPSLPAQPTTNVETTNGVAAGGDMEGNTITITGGEQKSMPDAKPKGN